MEESDFRFFLSAPRCFLCAKDRHFHPLMFSKSVVKSKGDSSIMIIIINCEEDTQIVQETGKL
jgi:hypothetical protein